MVLLNTNPTPYRIKKSQILGLFTHVGDSEFYPYMSKGVRGDLLSLHNLAIPDSSSYAKSDESEDEES